MRDLYWTFRNFRNRVTDFLRYRRVTANMDERFPEASAEDLARCDGVCIICREEMGATSRNKCLPCGHVFHLHCLRCARCKPHASRSQTTCMPAFRSGGTLSLKNSAFVPAAGPQ